MRYAVSAAVTILTMLVFMGSARGSAVDVSPEKIAGGEPAQMTRRYLLEQADQAAKRWRADYEKRTTPEYIAAYQRRMRQQCLDAIGGLPERTPLEPQVASTVVRPRYRVEKVIFQSQPKHYVTALLFLPERQRFAPPYPGVVVPCGHAQEAKGYPPYQTIGARCWR